MKCCASCRQSKPLWISLEKRTGGNSAHPMLSGHPDCLSLRGYYATGCAQNLQRLASNGISERHSPQVFVVGASGFLIMATR